MTENYIPLRVNRDFGDIITTYFEFFKQNLKKFTNVFLSYNGIFLVALLVVSYLMVSGFMGVIASENNWTTGVGNTDYTSYFMLIGFGALLFFVVFLIVAVLNYSLASSYMINYEHHQSQQFEKREVWKYASSQLGNIILFVLLMIPIYFVFLIISLIFAFIPLIGLVVQYCLQFFLAAWLGVSFFDMLQNKKSVSAGLGEGWNLVSSNFWKSIGVNFIMGLLLLILMMVVLIVPSVIIGIYTFHVVENDIDVFNSIVATVVYTLGTTVLLVVFIYGQCLSQFVNGILYFSLHEKTYNSNTRKRIEQIGESLL